jgi:hypothetical protein
LSVGKLPRAEELPRPEEGLDAARVEEAFASFADRVRELESIAAELREELRTLRSERVSFPRPLRAAVDEDWPPEAGATPGPAPDWVSAVPAPIVRPLRIPRIVFEGAFLLLVALFAGLADLSATSIVLVMAGAWALIAVSEWAAAAKRARWRLEQIPPPLEPSEGAEESTGPWNMPVVEATAVALPDVSESHTVVATLPAEENGAAGEDAGPAENADLAPRRRLRLPRRHKPEPTAADPWEA